MLHFFWNVLAALVVNVETSQWVLAGTTERETVYVRADGLGTSSPTGWIMTVVRLDGNAGVDDAREFVVVEDFYDIDCEEGLGLRTSIIRDPVSASVLSVDNFVSAPPLLPTTRSDRIRFGAFCNQPPLEKPGMSWRQSVVLGTERHRRDLDPQGWIMLGRTNQELEFVHSSASGQEIGWFYLQTPSGPALEAATGRSRLEAAHLTLADCSRGRIAVAAHLSTRAIHEGQAATIVEHMTYQDAEAGTFADLQLQFLCRGYSGGEIEPMSLLEISTIARHLLHESDAN